MSGREMLVRLIAEELRMGAEPQAQAIASRIIAASWAIRDLLSAALRSAEPDDGAAARMALARVLCRGVETPCMECQDYAARVWRAGWRPLAEEAQSDGGSHG